MSNIRQTSIEAYHYIKSSGLLGSLRTQVYDILFNHGPLTQGETWNIYFKSKQRHDIAPRFAELHKRGVIQCIGERPCGVTGRMSMLWDVTDKLPIVPEKKKSKTQIKIEEAVQKERQMCAELAIQAGASNVANLILNR